MPPVKNPYLNTVCLVIILGLSGCQFNFNYKGQVNYYLDAEKGNDRNRGTSPEKPWKTLDRLSQTEIHGGDVIYLRSGQALKGSIDLKNIIGTDQNPLVITSYGRGRAKIDAGDTTGIFIEHGENIVIKNLVIAGSGRLHGNTGNGVEFRMVSKGTIDSIEVSGFLWSGIRVSGGQDIWIVHAWAHDNGYSGIDVESGQQHVIKNASEFETMHNLYIGYSVAENNPGCPLVKDNHSGNGILISGVVKGVIEYCEAMNNGWDMPRGGNGPVGIWAYMCDSVVIQQCYSHHNKTSPAGKDGGGFDFDGGVTHSTMQYNHSAWNEGGGYGLFQYAAAASWGDNIIQFNTSLNDGSKNSKAGIHVWSDPSALPMKGCVVLNNIIVSNQGYGVRFEPGDYKDFKFHNNIFVLTTSSDHFIDGEFTMGDTATTFDNNQYWSFYRSTRKMPQPEVMYDPDPIFSEPALDIKMTGY